MRLAGMQAMYRLSIRRFQRATGSTGSSLIVHTSLEPAPANRVRDRENTTDGPGSPSMYLYGKTTASDAKATFGYKLVLDTLTWNKRV